MSKTVVGLFLLMYLLLTTNHGQNVAGRTTEKRLIYSECGVPYELSVLSIKHFVGHVFLYAEHKYFNETDLSALFRCLSKKYPEFAHLNIIVFSDRDNLSVAVKNHLYPRPDVNPPVDSEWDCENVKRGLRPCPVGYFRAIYLRFDGREFFDFSDDPNKVRLTRVFIQKPNQG